MELEHRANDSLHIYKLDGGIVQWKALWLAAQQMEKFLWRRKTMIWQKYYELEPYIRCKNDGRDLIGKELIITEKRDGENVSLWLDENNEVHISSHNLIEADKNITERMKAVSEFDKAVNLLKIELSFNNHLILYGELINPIGATQIEPKKKHSHWVIFDIWSEEQKRYLDYNYVYQRAYQFKIPVVKCLGVELPRQYEDLEVIKQKWLKFCKRHRREGFVGKNYKNQIFFKEKIDLPNLKRMHTTQRIKLPPMPTEKCIRALQHAWDEVVALSGSLAPHEYVIENWKNKSIVMPIVAKWFSMEAKEHNFEMANPYWWWVNTPIEKIKNGSNTETTSAAVVQ